MEFVSVVSGTFALLSLPCKVVVVKISRYYTVRMYFCLY